MGSDEFLPLPGGLFFCFSQDAPGQSSDCHVSVDTSNFIETNSARCCARVSSAPDLAHAALPTPMSAYGYKQTLASLCVMSVVTPGADISWATQTRVGVARTRITALRAPTLCRGRSARLRSPQSLRHEGQPLIDEPVTADPLSATPRRD